MELNSAQCYAAVVARDARFDGRFFVAVRTTRIYCRPICRVKTPLQKNCAFYSYAAGAEAAGYRPCKRCRPELAPGNSLMEVSGQLARATAFQIGQDFLAGGSLAQLAEKLGVTDRQMRRVFRAEFGVSPVEFWQTQRLLLAKQLLTDSAMAVTAVAMASGFGSLRRFNALLKARYRMPPTALRKQQMAGKAEAFAEFSFGLSYRPPLDWDKLLGFLGKRAIPGVEAVADGVYLRTVAVRRGGKRYVGHLEVRHEEVGRLGLRLSDGLLPVCAVVVARVKRLFDLQADPAAIGMVLGDLCRGCEGLRVPGSFDGFEMAVRAILGQQISVAGARTLAGRMAERLGEAVMMVGTAKAAGLGRLFPTAKRVAAAGVREIGRLGVTSKRAETLLALAEAVARGEILLEPGHSVEGTLEKLRRIGGIGEWTAQYIAMRALAWPDAFPGTDLGIKKALGGIGGREILLKAEAWRPWRSYAAMHLWNQLEVVR